MYRVFAGLVTLQILFLLNLWLMTSQGENVLKALHLAKGREVVGIIGISGGPLVQIIVLLFLIYIINNSNKEGLKKFPAFGLEFENDKFERHGVIGAFLLICIFPLFAFAHFWDRFLKYQAWNNQLTLKGEEVGLWEVVSGCHFLAWNKCRYGAISGAYTKNEVAVSFVPFWQPFLAATLTLISLGLTIALSVRFYRLLKGFEADKG